MSARKVPSARTMVLAALLLTETLLAQVPKGKPLDLKLIQVNDRRSNGRFFSSLTLRLEVTSIRSSDVGASRVLLESAVDDAGSSLIKESSTEPQLEANSSMGTREGAPLSVSVELKNPPRATTAIKQVRGELELYMPARDPNSVALIPKFRTQSGKSLSHGALKANGVGISILSRAQFDAANEKRVAKRREEEKANGYEGADLESAMAIFLGSLFTPEESDVLLKVTDPKKRIESIAYVDESGEVKRAMTREQDGVTVLSTWETVEPGWSLRINMKTAKNIIRHPFVLDNVPLP